ncbi:4-hydroxyphenylacetate 3-hydroxylase N-terminal domain-containing protein [Streptomyces sp. NPDC127091]|uniref:4-hydroxyphenylacetate 3-hydroxylase N-terminal domain-containing protein n=1 Tax=Streptomyces sp. NPDC127091 TaxID=3347134 RepID=UPI003665ACC5
MAIRSSEQYRAGLHDGRRVFHRGQQVKDVVEDPELRPAVDHSALCYDLADTHPELAIDVEGGEKFSAFYRIPRSPEDLTHRGRLIEASATAGAGTIVLKEVGSDALFALLRATEGEGAERARAYFDRVRRDDVALAVAQTDVKGDRALPPHRQADPDLYLRVVDEDAETITVRGAKVHTSFAPNADEIVVLPTRAMGPDDRDYALSFAIPVDTPGLTLYVSPYLAGERKNPFDFPVSSQHKMLESLTVFDDVRVPKDQVFLDRVPELAGPLAIAFVDYHRFTAVNYKLPLLDTLIGAAHLVAELNGISRAGHVKDKLTSLIAYAETVRGLGQLAALRSQPGAHGVQQPDPLAVNMAKYTFAHGFHDAVAKVMDLSGGLLVTGPGGEDWDNPEIRPVLEKYFAAAGPAEERLRVLNLIADLTARDFGGYQAVLATHAEGSLEAEKMQIARSYDPSAAIAYARRLARLDG